MTTGRVVPLWRSCPRPCCPVPFRTAPIVARVVRLSRASTRMHVGNRPPGATVEVPGRNDRGTRLPTWNPRGRSWPAWWPRREHRPGCTSVAGRVVSPWRSCPRPCRPVPFRTAADRGPHGAPVESIDQDARRQPAAWWPRQGPARVDRGPRSAPVEGIDQDARRQPATW